MSFFHLVWLTESLEPAKRRPMRGNGFVYSKRQKAQLEVLYPLSFPYKRNKSPDFEAGQRLPNANVMRVVHTQPMEANHGIKLFMDFRFYGNRVILCLTLLRGRKALQHSRE